MKKERKKFKIKKKIFLDYIEEVEEIEKIVIFSH